MDRDVIDHVDNDEKKHLGKENEMKNYFLIVLAAAAVTACDPDSSLGLPTVQQSPGIVDTIQVEFDANGGEYSLTATPNRAVLSVRMARVGQSQNVSIDTVLMTSNPYLRLDSTIDYERFSEVPSLYEPEGQDRMTEGSYRFYMRSDSETHSVRMDGYTPPTVLDDLSAEAWSIVVEVADGL